MYVIKLKILILFFLLLGSDHIWTKYFIKGQKQISISHSVFHHHLLNNHVYIRDAGRYGKSTVITNSLGFRDYTTRDVNLKNKNRIVLIGDSFIEGVLLDYEFIVDDALY